MMKAAKKVVVNGRLFVQTLSNIKLKCVRISLKWVIVHIVLNASLLTASMNSAINALLLKEPIEQKTADLFGKKVFVVMDFDANFLTTKPRKDSRMSSCL